MKIAISCDENPGDPGAVHNNIVERSLNIQVATVLVTALQRCKQTVWFDDTITYIDRVRLANQGNYDVLVACAHNASSNPAAEGAQLLICTGGDQIENQLNVANIVGEQLVKDGIAQHYGIVHEDVYECCQFNKCSVYIEFLFETNARDVARIKQLGYSQDAAESACKGLAQAFGFVYIPPSQPQPSPEPKPPPIEEDQMYAFNFQTNPPDDLHPVPQVTTVEDAVQQAHDYCVAHPGSTCDCIITIGPV
jgi:N-acetylmuramoyl-L-alanine amidase-like protein